MAEEKTNGRKKKIAMVVFGLIALILAVAIFFYLQYKSTHITTDDAFIEGHIHSVSPRIPGTVRNVLVTDNQSVKAGDLLLKLDPTDYEVKVQEIEASLEAEKQKLAETDSKLDAAKKQLAEAKARADAIGAMMELQKARFEQAERDRERAENLFSKDAISKEKYEKTMTDYKVAIAQVKASVEGQRSYQSAVETQRAVVKQVETGKKVQLSNINHKEAQLAAARLDLGYTGIYAPVDGQVTRKSVEAGNRVQAGQPLMAVVPLDNIYVVANYKETELKKIRPGMKVEMEVDTYPGKTFKGTVDSIMAGTGAAFSLFPPENATGNYVKIVQRIPVKIVFDKDTDPEHVLRIGMSVVPTVIVE